MKIKIKDANLYNCEGFMTDSELVDKINTAFKTGNSHNTKEDGETIMGMTLHDLIQIQPRDFFTPTGDGETLFTKLEVNRIIMVFGSTAIILKDPSNPNRGPSRYIPQVTSIGQSYEKSDCKVIWGSYTSGKINA